ncbi:MAG: hypothetical protein ACLUUO_16325 [Sellimonas intestinalis]
MKMRQVTAMMMVASGSRLFDVYGVMLRRRLESIRIFRRSGSLFTQCG